MVRRATRLLVLVLSSLVAPGCSVATFDTRDDLTISAHVKTALLNDPGVGGLRLGVETFQGVVTLSGTVPTAADVDRAIAAARKVRGVKEVKSSLKVLHAGGVEAAVHHQHFARDRAAGG